MAKALYRKYRPNSLEGVIGQPQVTEVLAKSLKAGKISHAYLFIGPRGCGKTSVARIFAHEINGFPYTIEDDYVDIIEIDGASNRGIDNIRELREKALIAPTSGKYKVYIIDEVHMLTKEAFNALLKILEEPPKHVIFIMATTDAYKVPITITSRAQTFTFKLADHETMFKFLKSVAEKEKIKIDDEALSLIVKRGGGSFRDSLSLLDQISSLSEIEITKELVTTAMGLPEDEKITNLFSDYLAGDVAKITTDIKDLLVSGVKPETIAEEMISKIVDDPDPNLFPLLKTLPEVKAPYPEAKLLVALSFGLSDISLRRGVRSAAARGVAPAARGRPPLGTRTTRRVDGPAGRAPELEISDKANQDTQTKKSDSGTRIENAASFDWEVFLEQVKEANDAIYAQLLKTKHEFENGILDIYPEKRIVKTILSRDNNKIILDKIVGSNVKITIHDTNESSINKSNDKVLSKISDIMGGEVKNDGGESPF